MRVVAALALAVMVGGCSPALQVSDQMQGGTIQVAPHPSEPGAYRVIWRVTPGFRSAYPVNNNTPEGRAELAPLIVGCPRTTLVEEQRLPIGPDIAGRPRHLLVTKVTCGA